MPTPVHEQTLFFDLALRKCSEVDLAVCCCNLGPGGGGTNKAQLAEQLASKL